MTTKESTNICPFLSITPPYLQTIFGTFTPTQFYENHRAFGYAKRIRLCGPFLQPSLKSKPVSVKRIPISCLHVWDKWHSSFQNLYIQCTWSDSDGELHKCLALMYWVSFALNLKKKTSCSHFSSLVKSHVTSFWPRLSLFAQLINLVRMWWIFAKIWYNIAVQYICQDLI